MNPQPSPARPSADAAGFLRARLDHLALTGGGYRRLVDALADEVGRRIRLVGADGRLLVDSAVPGEDPRLDFVAPVEGGLTPAEAASAFGGADLVLVRCTDGLTARALGVAAGGRRVALVLAEVAGEEDEIPAELLAAASVAIAIEGGRRDLRKEAEVESGAWLVGELRFGSRRSPLELVDLARRVGLDLEGDHAALALAYVGDDRTMWEKSLAWLPRPVLADGTLAWCVVADDVAAEAATIRDRLSGFVTGRVRAALGPVVRGSTATRGSFAVAARSLALVTAHDDHGPAVYQALDLEGLLLSVPGDRLDAFVDHHLGALVDHPELLETLEAWVMTGGSRAEVGRLVSIHRNSVGHRMERIRALLAVDPADPMVGRDLAAAFAARRARRAVEQAGG